jgi:GH25 family lysozyme M1 (1,4-beta-N-acetylmuramidase)
MTNGSWFKFMDDVAMARDAKNANSNIKVVARFHRDYMQQFSLDANETRNRARAFIASWLNDSFFIFAPYIDAVEDFNEYWAASHTPEETEARILWIDSLIYVWENEVLPKHTQLERIKWCLGNAAVGNDIPWQVARTATQADSGPHYLGYHGYVSVVSKDYMPPEGDIAIPGERSPDEFEWGSGRILNIDELIYKPRGYEPRYIFTEGGLVRDLNGKANLQPNDGWKHQQVAGGSMDRYVELMSEVSALYQEWNYNNNDRLEGYVFFTSGDFDWPDFHINGVELTEIIERTGAFPGTPTYPVPPDPDPPVTIEYPVKGLDISHWQGEFDGEISYEQGNSFVIVKASDGFILNPNSDDPLVAPEFAPFTKEAVLTNHLVGAYHFFQPSVSAARQALAFLRALEMVEEQNLPPVLDLEATVNTTKELFQGMVLEWLNIVEDQTGQVPMIYSNVSFYDIWLSDPRFDRYPLWIANWSDHLTMPSLPFRRSTWELWQWTSEGNGGMNGVSSAYVDLNRFNGDYVTFHDKYFDNWLSPITPPPPDELPENPCPIREQYARVVHVLPDDLTPEQLRFALDSIIDNGQTITFSYDDAGATPCIDNTAVLWFLTEEEQPEFEAWFAEFYPNTSLAFVGVRSAFTSPATASLSQNFLPLIKKVLLRLRR